MAKLRIAINALFQASGGSLTNLAQLLREWGASGALDEHEFVIFASRGSAAALDSEVPAVHLAKLGMKVLPAADGGLVPRLWAEQVQMARRLRALRIDVVFCPGNVVPYATSIPTVATFQNAAPFCASVTRRTMGTWKWLRFALLGWFIRITAKRATRVIFISSWFRDLFVREHGFPPERGVVIPRGRIEEPALAHDAAFERSLGITMPYVLCVSHLNPYKNIVELVEGFVSACAKGGIEDRQLVIAGMFTFPWYHRLVMEKLRQLGGAAENVILTGMVPTAGVSKLLAGAESFVFTSTCENCPTSLIEALSHGLPIASSNLGPMPEVGGEAMLYFDPYDPSAIAGALLSLMQSDQLRGDLSRRAAQRARELAGESEVAQRTLDAIRSVATAAS